MSEADVQFKVQCDDATLHPLAQTLEDLCRKLPFQTTFSVKHCQDGRSIRYGGALATPSASTRKILFLMCALAQVHQGKISLSHPVTTRAELTQGVVSGVFYFMTPGITFPLRDALVQMIITSDNVCTSLVGELLSVDLINDHAQHLGMQNTRITEIVPPRHMPVTADFDFVAHTCPDDQILLLEAIRRGAQDETSAALLGASKALCQFALNVLSWQRYREMIPGLLPTGTKVCNKTGGGKNGVMDAGIVYAGGHPLYTLALYTDHVPHTLPDGLPGHAAAKDLAARISRACWDFFQSS